MPRRQSTPRATARSAIRLNDPTLRCPAAGHVSGHRPSRAARRGGSALPTRPQWYSWREMRACLIAVLLFGAVAHAAVEDELAPRILPPREEQAARKERWARREKAAGQVLMLTGTGMAVVGAITTGVATTFLRPAPEVCLVNNPAPCAVNIDTANAYYSGIAMMVTGSFLVASGAVWLIIASRH